MRTARTTTQLGAEAGTGSLQKRFEDDRLSPPTVQRSALERSYLALNVSRDREGLLWDFGEFGIEQ